MTLSRRRVVAGAGAALATPFILSSARAQAVVTLKLHHFLGPMANAHAKLLAPWAKKVEADSQGKIKIDIYPAMQLGGTPPQLYDQARDGVADIVWTLPGYSSGRFPLSETAELPFVANRLASVNAPGSHAFYISNGGLEETKDVKLLCFWSHDAGVIHASKAIKTLADLKGMKLRNPTRLAGEALKALGATTVGMPVPQVPESLAQRVIDGAVVPWEVVPAIKVQELVKFHTEIPGSPTLYTATFFLAMNKAKYESLPDDLRQVIDKNSGLAFATMAGSMWDNEAKSVRAAIEKRGNTVSSISEEEAKNWVNATESVRKAWIEQVKAKGLDGEKLIHNFKTAIAKYEKT